MKGKVIAVANMKGGVGKTATVVGLAETLAAATKKDVLVIDLDAQANASICQGGSARLAQLIDERRTIEVFIENYFLGDKTVKFDDCIREHISNVTHLGDQLPIALLASSPKLRNLEYKLIHQLTRQKLNWDQIAAGHGLSGAAGASKRHTATSHRRAQGSSVSTGAAIRRPRDRADHGLHVHDRPAGILSHCAQRRNIRWHGEESETAPHV